MRIFAIGMGVGITLTAIVWGVAALLGAPEELYGSLFLACSLVASLTGATLVIREQEESRPKR